MKALKIGLLIFIVLGITAYLYFPTYYLEGAYTKPAWWQKSLFNFCKYHIPEQYEITTYREGLNLDKYLIIFSNKNTSQLIAMSKIRGFYFVPFEKISFYQSEIKRSLRWERRQILNNFVIITNLPAWHFFRQDNLSKLPDNLILKGLTVEHKEQYDTPKAHVFYVKGTFTKIGFFKKMPFPWGFATPIFDFLWPQKGALAILNNKDTNETIIVASAVPISKEFDEKTFKTFIESITFDKEIYKPALLEGITEEPKPKVKYSF